LSTTTTFSFCYASQHSLLSSHSFDTQFYIQMARLITLGSLASLVALTVAIPTPNLVRRSGGKDVIIQMFQWNWDSIAQECTDFIGPAGYGYVQVSPAQETITGDQWWTDYQPVSYIIGNKHGTRERYRNMVDTCHRAGVKVMADIIPNHMAGLDSGSGTSGSTFTHYNYPGIYEKEDFHYCGTKNNAIVNWSDPHEVQFCQLDGLADLATGTENVMQRLAVHLNDLMSLGVDGLRIDAAKHVPASDLSNIMGRLSKTPSFITQEVYFGGGAGVQPQEYTGVGNVQAFQYAFALKSAFKSKGLAMFQSLDNQGWLSSSSANTFVANHDTERDGSTLNDNDSSASDTYRLAHVLMLAHPYGTPTVLSSYQYSSRDDGAPDKGVGKCGANSEWKCQHRYTAIANMVAFHNTVGSERMTNWVAPSSQRIAFGRGSLGFVAINNEASAWDATFSTSLPAGTYCDAISGSVSSGKCTGTSVTVDSSGSFKVSISSRNAIGIHAGAKL